MTVEEPKDVRSDATNNDNKFSQAPSNPGVFRKNRDGLDRDRSVQRTYSVQHRISKSREAYISHKLSFIFCFTE
jgi:hypothetical protein